MVRLIKHNLNQRVGSWVKNERKTGKGLGGNYSWDTRSSWTNYPSSPFTMAERCRELQLICPTGQTQKNKTQRTKNGARIEIASFSEWLANRKKTLRTKQGARIEYTKKGARIEIASFSEWLANRKRCAQRKAQALYNKICGAQRNAARACTRHPNKGLGDN